MSSFWYYLIINHKDFFQKGYIVSKNCFPIFFKRSILIKTYFYTKRADYFTDNKVKSNARYKERRRSFSEKFLLALTLPIRIISNFKRLNAKIVSKTSLFGSFLIEIEHDFFADSNNSEGFIDLFNESEIFQRECIRIFQCS